VLLDLIGCCSRTVSRTVYFTSSWKRSTGVQKYPEKIVTSEDLRCARGNDGDSSEERRLIGMFSLQLETESRNQMDWIGPSAADVCVCVCVCVSQRWYYLDVLFSPDMSSFWDLKNASGRDSKNVRDLASSDICVSLGLSQTSIYPLRVLEMVSPLRSNFLRALWRYREQSLVDRSQGCQIHEMFNRPAMWGGERAVEGRQRVSSSSPGADMSGFKCKCF